MDKRTCYPVKSAEPNMPSPMRLPSRVTACEDDDKELRSTPYYVQWSIDGTRHRVAPKTVTKLPAGRYSCGSDSYGLYFEEKQGVNTELIRFPETVADAIISEFDTFWSKEEEYSIRGEPHKRGFLLWGPPGGGKTSTVEILVKDFVSKGNIVIDFSFDTTKAITQFRIVEPDRKIMVIIEDIDIFMEHNELEQNLLLFLDGGIQHKNTVVIATTNYPEKLPDRIINRPSRFDRVSYIGTPSAEERKFYLDSKCRTTTDEDKQQWVEDTNGWTLAHLKELIISVEVNGLSYEETFERLKLMRKKISSSSEYEKELRDAANFGFNKEG